MADGRTNGIMTKDKLKQLKWLRREISDLRGRMAEMDGGDNVPVVKDRVKASGREWPFVEGYATVRGRDEKTALKKSLEIERLWMALKKREAQARDLKTEIEEYIGGIEDSRTRMMFEYRFIDGFTSEKVGELMDCERSTVEKTISKYLREHP